MKKKYMLIVFIFVLFLGFIGYKLIMLQKYKTDIIAMDNKIIFNETMNINYNQSDNNELFDKMTYGNFFTGYNENENGINIKYNDNNEVVSFYKIVKDKQYIDVLSVNSYEMFSEDEKNNINFETEENMKKLLDKNNIKDDVDLLKYVKSNYYFKSNIFTCTKTMRNNFILNNLILVAYPEFESITLINGSLKGYIVNTTSTANVKDIHLLHDNNQYIITLSGEEITNVEFINNLLKSISFE